MVTGASRGIGKAICEKLLQENCQIVAVSRQIEKAFDQQPNVKTFPLDLSDVQKLPQRLRELHAQFPNITDVVCNAGVGRFGSIEEFSPEQIQSLINLNLTSHILTAREFLPAFKKRKQGSLIFIGSEAALAGGKKGAVYSATKFALRGFAQSLREESAGAGIKIGLINPGMVRSDFFNELNFRPGDEEDNYILPEDVAEAAWLLLNSRQGTNIDEINLSPQKKVIRFNP